MRNESVLHYTEEKELNWLKEAGFNKFNSTDSQAIYRISPVLINSQDGFVYPKVKLLNKEDLHSCSLIAQSKIEIAQVKNKFEAKENVFGNKVGSNEKTHSDFLDVVCGEDVEQKEDIDLKKPEDEDEGRKHFDKYNLLKAFKFVMDPYGSKAELNHEDDFTESNLQFESVASKMESLFGLNKNKDN